MTRKSYEILPYLKSKIPKATLLYGDNFLVEYYGQKVTESIKSDTNNNIEILKMYFDEYSFDSAFDILSQSSLFSDKTLLYTKIDKPIKSSECKKLIECLSKPDNENYWIVEVYNVNYDKDFKSFAKEFNATPSPLIIESRLFPPNLGEMVGFMRNKANELKLNIEDILLKNILEIYNLNLTLATKELEKLQLRPNLSEPISTKDIATLCDGISTYSIDELLDKILTKKYFLPLIDSMEQEGVNEREILNAFGKFFYTLFMFRAYAKIHGTINVGEILGYTPPRQISDRFVNNIKRFDEQKFIQIFDILNTWKIHSKSNNGKILRSINYLYKIQELV